MTIHDTFAVSWQMRMNDMSQKRMWWQGGGKLHPLFNQPAKKKSWYQASSFKVFWKIIHTTYILISNITPNSLYQYLQDLVLIPWYLASKDRAAQRVKRVNRWGKTTVKGKMRRVPQLWRNYSLVFLDVLDTVLLVSQPLDGIVPTELFDKVGSITWDLAGEVNMIDPFQNYVISLHWIWGTKWWAEKKKKEEEGKHRNGEVEQEMDQINDAQILLLYRFIW